MKYLLLIFITLTYIYANEIAVASDVNGNVTATISETKTTLKSGDVLSENMLIRTQDNSSITIVFKDNSKLVLGSHTLMNLKKFVFKPTEKKYDFQLYLEKGSASFESGKIGKLSPEDFVFKTPESTVAIRGTKFFVKVQ